MKLTEIFNEIKNVSGPEDLILLKIKEYLLEHFYFSESNEFKESIKNANTLQGVMNIAFRILEDAWIEIFIAVIDKT